MAVKRGNEQPVGDWPTITENHWYALSITSAVLTIVAVVGAFLYIFADGFDGESDTKLAQALAPFGVALFALVTFCTISWRGSISARQANQSESEGRARLLQEGAKLLSEPTKASHVSAGVATLGVLIDSGEENYAFRAMNLLADFVEDHMRLDHGNRHRSEISGVMRSGDENGANTGRDIAFSPPERDNDYQYDDYTTYWHFIPGFDVITYYGGEFSVDVNYSINDLRRVKFIGTTISLWNNVSIDNRFDRCTFRACSIASVSSIASLSHHQNYRYAFEVCDFSGCIFSDVEVLTKNFKEHNNYFIAGNPPTLLGSTATIDWSQILNCKEQKDLPVKLF
ncbi:hypothetical protein [Mesorhizobium sp. CO1-1-8]|uniref:hypothetical protein n=1 Tax=Mesorhizobium sp. CO1-1-8 TaxID=2876631 RepID=UPI001CD06EF6|nr:hypothetical protein [Mesorhizobium sp. CO1-1-8]MBZ9771470.1 hypothetical protein [Mesorhizobium sp. CO1-1-8]